MDYTLIVAKKDIKRIESYKYIIKRNIIDSTTIIPQWLQLLLKKNKVILVVLPNDTPISMNLALPWWPKRILGIKLNWTEPLYVLSWLRIPLWLYVRNISGTLHFSSALYILTHDEMKRIGKFIGSMFSAEYRQIYPSYSSSRCNYSWMKKILNSIQWHKLRNSLTN